MAAEDDDLAVSHRSLRARIAVLESWSHTVDRRTRTAAATANSPASVEYWIKKTGPELPEHVRRQQAEAKRSQYFARLSLSRVEAAARKRAAGE